jgi:hypothetical protein
MSEVNNTFGPLFVPGIAERQVLAHLEAWLSTYLAEVERQNDLTPGTLKRPQFYGASVEADTHPGEALPAIIVVSPGTEGEPIREGDGTWSAWYQFTIVAMIMAPDEIAVREMAGYYAAAIRGAVLQHAAIGGLADAVWWLGEEYQGEPGAQRNRTRGAALVHFRFKIPNIVDQSLGISEPPDDPLEDVPEWPVVDSAETTIENSQSGG